MFEEKKRSVKGLGVVGAEAQKPKTFRIAAFYAQNFSGRSARIYFYRDTSKKRVILSRDIKKVRKRLSQHIKCVIISPVVNVTQKRIYA